MQQNKQNLELVQKLTFELLSDFADICEREHINYYLSGGTLLGAVRHGGFIPWDDDADVMLLRKDYMKLIRNQHLYMDLQKRRILSAVDHSYPRDFARFIRTDYLKVDDCSEDEICPYIGIDVFPVDFVPHNQFLYSVLFHFLNIFKRPMGIYGSKKGTGRTLFTIHIRNILRPFINIIGGYRLANTVQFIELCSNRLCKKSVAALAGINGKKEKWDFKDYVPSIDLKFETRYFKCPQNYDIYLKNIYNDYMQLPPLEKRITHGIQIKKRGSNETAIL